MYAELELGQDGKINFCLTAILASVIQLRYVELNYRNLANELTFCDDATGR